MSLRFLSKPLWTESTTISTITPRATPTREISVIIETKVRRGFKYLRARVQLKDFKTRDL